VKANEGRFRFCYEQGLERRPELRGRVTTRFVIARDGSVAVAAAVAAESDLPDEAVVACVVRAFGALSFPEPAGGLVTVEYPYVFDKDGD
jgi:outer membrane biosynthesis protein TonB